NENSTQKAIVKTERLKKCSSVKVLEFVFLMNPSLSYSMLHIEQRRHPVRNLRHAFWQQFACAQEDCHLTIVQSHDRPLHLHPLICKHTRFLHPCLTLEVLQHRN